MPAGKAGRSPPAQRVLKRRQLLSANPVLTFGSGTGLCGATVAVPVTIANPAGIVGIDMTLTYPPQLHLASGGDGADVTEGSAASADGLFLNDNVINSSQTVYVSLYGVNAWAGTGGACSI